MDAKDYFKRGKEYYEKDNYSQAIAEFWKAMEMTHEPDQVKALREGTKDHGLEVLAMFLYEVLRQKIE